MTESELKKLYAENVDFESKADAGNQAARLQSYCESHTRCSKNHHRPVEDIDKPCPVCGSCVPFQVEAYPDASGAVGETK